MTSRLIIYPAEIGVFPTSITIKTFVVWLLLFFYSGNSFSQTEINVQSGSRITLKASEKYNKSNRYKYFWGEHYRKEWNTPVTVRIVSLDTLRGGLSPYQMGGGRQTQSIRLTDKDKREYVLRGVDKTLRKSLPEITKGTFIDNLADDQVSFSHPYASSIAAPLARAAGIYHATPELFYVPKQAALGKFNDTAGNILYTLEQRPDEDWATADNFGNSKKIVSTEKMLEKILEDNDHKIDQKLFVRARLFDMLIGDWGRHEDQWRWAGFKADEKTVYAPIPRDRDNAFSKFDGLLLKRVLSAANADHLQTFDYTLKNVPAFNFPARHLDHHLLNEMNREDWQQAAAELRSKLTDNIIDKAVKNMPPEVYPISGPEIAAKLKARRELLPQWAETYFKFLNKEVEITGTEDSEMFEVNRLSDEETEISIYKITKEGKIKKNPFFHRVFKNSQTDEIRLYGIAGNDQYNLRGKVNNGIKIRLIGGKDTDSYSDESVVKGMRKNTKIYDNPGNNIIKRGNETDITISEDSSINAYDYNYFHYDKKGLKPLLFYSNADRIFVGLGYKIVKQKWRRPEDANTHYADVKYSLGQKAFSSTYYSNFLELFGKWNLRNYINYDEIRWTNFYGLGNETIRTTEDNDYNRVRSKEILGRITVDKILHNRIKFYTGLNYQTYRIINDTGRFLIKQSGIISPAQKESEKFGGAEAGFVYQNINDSILPVKGFGFHIFGNYSDNLNKKANTVSRFGAETNLYIPLSRKFNLFVRGGGTALTGDPEFYQYNTIGGNQSLRGYRRDRFYGHSTLFNQNELRFITDVHSYAFKGKFGIFGLYDAGRVWLKGEDSNTWHTGYGGGIIISPFNRLSVSVSYAKSPEDTNIHLQIIKPL